LDELRAVAPDAVKRIGERDFFRIARIPGILGQAGLLRGTLGGEGRKGRAGRWIAPSGGGEKLPPAGTRSPAGGFCDAR
jgi:hypothetical protein